LIDWLTDILTDECAIVTLSLRDIGLEVYRDLETRVRGHSRSSEPTRIDPPPMTSY